MKERPILFSAPMVRAILEGRKTQTRRIVKPLPSWKPHSVCQPDGAADPWSVWFHYPETERVGHIRHCPYGKPGDRLWVRETWTGTWHPARQSDTNMYIAYAADGSEAFHNAPEDYALPKAAQKVGNWVTPLFMPRWASRILLEVSDVRVERLHEISEEDAKAEGVEPYSMTAQDIADMQISDCSPQEKELARLMGPGSFSHKFTFQMLWDEIHGARKWDVNPWVWVVNFKSQFE